MEDKKSIIEKIRKLLTLEEGAKDIGSLNEAEVAAKMAQKFMMEYNISTQDIDEAHHKANDPYYGIDEKKADYEELWKKNEGSWIPELFAVVARNNFCRSIFPYTLDYKYVTLVGKEFNTEMVEYITKQLIARLRPLAKEAWLAYDGIEKKNTFYRGFYRGAVVGIGNQLYEQKEKMVKEMPKADALIRLNNNGLDLYMKKEMRLKSKAHTSSSSFDGSSRGYAVGKSMSINKGIAGNPTGSKLLN